MDAFFAYLPFIIFIAAGLVLGRWLHQRAQQRLVRWLSAHGYDFVRFDKMALFVPGPFVLRNKRGWVVSRIVVHGEGGRERSGWVRYPGGIIDLLPERFYTVEISWDDGFGD